MTVKKGRNAIELEEVSFLYDGTLVLDNISFTIETGDYVGILGPNGSGKTTLLKIILGLIEPAAGEVTIFGESIRDFKQHSWIGFVPQHVSVGDWQFPATVEEIVRSGRTATIGLLRRFSSTDAHACAEAMEIAEVSDLAKRRIGELSGGQRQRVFIARALAASPKVLILDEPTVGVDIARQEKFYAFLKKLNEKHNITIIFVSHDIDVAVHEAKTILCLNKQLVCHVASHDFINKDFLEKMYGTKGKYILHGH